MKKVYITGVSGTGKTTIAKELEKRGIYTINIDEVQGLCSWISKKTGEKIEQEVELNKEFIDTHSYICDTDHLKKLMAKGDDFVVVLGLASNQDDFLDMFDLLLLLQCEPETFIQRIEQRTDNVFGKDKTAQKSILAYSKIFEKEMLSRGAISIDVGKPIEEVVNQIIGQVDSLRWSK